MTGPPAGDAYLCEKVRARLATDPRVANLSLAVESAGGRLHITGSVATEARRRAVSEVAAEVAGGHPVVNEVTVVDLHQPGGTEVVS